MPRRARRRRCRPPTARSAGAEPPRPLARAGPGADVPRHRPAPPGTTYAGLWVPPAALRAQVAGAGERRLPRRHARRGARRLGRHGRAAAASGRPELRRRLPQPGPERGRSCASHGWPGVLYLELHNLDAPGGLSPSARQTLIRAGWEIDAHSLTHPDLTTLDAAALRHEVAGSRAALRRALRRPGRRLLLPGRALRRGRRGRGPRRGLPRCDDRGGRRGTHVGRPLRAAAHPRRSGDGAAAVVAKVRAALGSGP